MKYNAVFVLARYSFELTVYGIDHAPEMEAMVRIPKVEPATYGTCVSVERDDKHSCLRGNPRGRMYGT